MTHALLVRGLIAAALLAAACSGKDAPEGTRAAQAGDKPAASQARTRLTLQLNWVPEPEFGGFYAAKHLGFYDEHGLDVDILAGSAGVQTWKMVATNKVPLAIATSDEVVGARLKDADVVGVFSVYQKSPRALMVHESSGVSSLEEIFTSGAIKRVAMEAGLHHVRHLEKRYGFDKVEVIQYGGNLSLFLQDKTMAQQCYIFSEPVDATQQGAAVRAFSVAESGYNPYMAVVITSGAFLAKDRPAVEAFVHATRKGWQAYLDDPGPTNQYMLTQGATMTLEAMKIAADLQRSYVTDGDGTSQYLGYMSKARWKSGAELLVELGEIPSVPDISRCYVNIPPG